MNNNHSSDPNNSAHNEQQDPELAQLFGADEIPSHQASFWTDLETNLQTDLPGRKTQSPNPSDPNLTTSADTVQLITSRADGTDIGAFDQSHQKRRPFPLLAAAAVVAVLGGLGTWFGLSQTTSTEGTEVATQETIDEQFADQADSQLNTGETAGTENDELSLGSIDYFDPASQRKDLGSGQFVGFSPDGEHVLVVDNASTGQTGCEGGEPLALFSQNLSTGERFEALPTGSVETGDLFLHRLDGVYNTEWRVAGTVLCDGVRTSTWTATMAPNGSISDVEQLPISDIGIGDLASPSGDDPFDGIDLFDVPDRKETSPNGRFTLTWPDNTLTITGEQNERFELPVSGGELIFQFAWSPNNEVLATLIGEDSAQSRILLWNFQTGQTAEFDSPFGSNLAFDPSGRLLGSTLNNIGPTDPSIRIYNFGEERTFNAFDDSNTPTEDTPAEQPEEAEPEDAEPEDAKPEEAEPEDAKSAQRCSASDAAPMNTDGVAPLVAETMVKIDTAAANCDWELFGEIVDDDFVASFGGGDAIESWQASEQLWFDGDMSWKSTMQLLRQLLREPNGSLSDRLEGEPSGTVWPQVFNSERGCGEYTDEDIASMDRLEYGLDDITDGCEFADGYIGFRTAIADDGRWMFFVAGD